MKSFKQLKNTLKKDQTLEWIQDIYEHSWLWYVVRSFKDHIWHPILYHTTRRYHILDLRDGGNGYGVGWHDSDSQILQANFLILKNYVEKENPFVVADWEWDDLHKSAAQEIKLLYKWWTEDRAEEHKALAAEWLKRDLSYRLEDTSLGFQQLIWTGDETKDLHKWEQDLYEKDTEMLIRLIKIRGYLWT